uniref:ATP-dependent DNA helicase PIF1-like n=1 Tax=Tanacetum cinerariifolium TaxID=118510 RepID=A0A6L2MUB3_TANCI|nr:ATP-dependent DNA helicase PIF1-like [Tanacetum cinerariifolium]
MVYLSCDSIDKNERGSAIGEVVFSEEFINGMKFSGVTNHRLALKVGVPIMLLRNIDQANGLCNETRLQVLRLTRTSIQEKKSITEHTLERKLSFQVHDDDEDFDVHETYTDLFSIKVSYGDSFIPKGGRELGYIYEWFSIVLVDDIMNELGYSATDIRYYHFLKVKTNLVYGLVALGSDQDVKELFKYVVITGDFS